MKKRKVTHSLAKKRAWAAFSIYIRTRDSDANGNGNCFTCGKIYPIKELQAGHWIPGRHLSILFDERGVHAQCYHCNIGLKGNPIEYYDQMLKKYGKKVCEELKALDKLVVKYKVTDLLELEQFFKSKLTPKYERDHD